MDYLDGGQENDHCYGGADDDWIAGGDGDDTLSSGEGADLIFGGSGDDIITLDSDGVWAPDFLALNVNSSAQFGTGEVLSLSGFQRYTDISHGGDGNDTIVLGSKNDAFFAHDSFSEFHLDALLSRDFHENYSTVRIIDMEVIEALEGDDLIDLTSSDYFDFYSRVEIYGGDGDDTIWGSASDDIVFGGEGDDVIFTGAGINYMTGGAGSDTFQFTTSFGNTTISDFNPLEFDVLQLFNHDGRKFQSETARYENGNFTIDYCDLYNNVNMLSVSLDLDASFQFNGSDSIESWFEIVV